ncbi:UDP-glucosyltransferase 73B2 [Actinidia rufa]|uniref:UDP-glucosyltransferase 73B2 n=1 Tax=Actinidia rufa TaxID=165716 RepID=A0A7J0EHV5_9ERIC|nr:UDP-glucosyltransferase 73B2 [Actinidia rufa]
MDSTGEPLHVIFLPYMAPGHMIPMVDIARLFAAHGVHVTIITTKMNALRFKATIDRDVAAADRHITLEILPFPSAEAGLPEGCENLADTPSHEMAMRLFHTIDLLQPRSKSSCVIAVPIALSPIGKTTTTFLELFGRVKEAEKKSYGMVANSFHALESAYADYYRKAIGIKGWHVGPVSLFNKDEVDNAERGDKATINRESCFHWLDSKEPNSVLYVCFGSLSRFSKTQLTEMVHAFEDTSCSFIWVVPKVLKTNEAADPEWWLPEGFKERMEESGKGLILRGWAPQVLRIGVPVGNEDWKMSPTDETSLISRDKIYKAVSQVMDGGNEAEGMRRVVKRLGELAMEAIEDGGSSYNDLKTLMEDIKLYRQKNRISSPSSGVTP